MPGQQMQPQPKEPTPQEAQARAEQMFKLDQQIKGAFRQGREALWEAAAAMAQFDEENGWTALNYDKLSDWLADPEVSMTRRTWYRLIGAYRDTVGKGIAMEEVKQLEMSKVDIVLGKVRTGEKPLKEALSDAETLGARDLRQLYYDKPDSEPEPPTDPDGSANVGTPPEVGGEPIQASDVEPGDGDPIPVTGEDDEPLGDETGEVSDLVETGEDEPIEGEVVEDETAPKTPSSTSGVVSPESQGRAMAALEAIDLGINGMSDAVRLHGLRIAREFIVREFQLPDGGS